MVDPVIGNPKSTRQTEVSEETWRQNDVELLRAIASRTRYNALRFIASTGEACVCDIEAELDVSQGAVSQALSKLTEAGLLTRRKDGRWRYYATTPRASEIIKTLDDTRNQ